ncbi:MAG: hypothetical protein CFE21_10690 [Bacteroidetes bacterium B1(2017)]|nr:MAG: hypothetical protein CFE21_10690 [Bacteroidetes bacterium B1(2017)]
MKKLRVYFAFLLLLLIGNSAWAQKGFRLVNLTTEETRDFRFGSPVLFELKNKTYLDSNTTACVNPEKGVYEMRLTNMVESDLVFNDSILVPKSQLNWMFVKTPSRGVKQFFGAAVIACIYPFYTIGPGYGVVASIFILPIGAVLLHSSQRHYYNLNLWTIKPAMYGGKYRF